MDCPKHIVQYLRGNGNTGIEYEFGIACALMNSTQRNDFIINITDHHLKKDIIQRVCESTKQDVRVLLKEHNCDNDYYISLGATQDDSLGASDVLVCCNGEILFGISVKYDNKNNWNPSSRNFIGNAAIDSLKEKYRIVYLPEYIKDMRNRFGDCKILEEYENKPGVKKHTWSRMRSPTTDKFIDLLRDEVIREWGIKTKEEKEKIMINGFQVMSPIPFYIVNINKKLSCETIEPEMIFNVDKVSVEKYETSYIAFKINGKTIVKLQVKFNNGFIEKKSKKTSSTFKVDEVIFKNGDPFGSWNFNI